jgi:hypothetical protein
MYIFKNLYIYIYKLIKKEYKNLYHALILYPGHFLLDLKFYPT